MLKNKISAQSKKTAILTWTQAFLWAVGSPAGMFKGMDTRWHLTVMPQKWSLYQVGAWARSYLRSRPTQIKLFSKFFPPRTQDLPRIFHWWGSNSNVHFMRIYWLCLFTLLLNSRSSVWCFFSLSLKTVSTTFSPPTGLWSLSSNPLVPPLLIRPFFISEPGLTELP